MKRSFRGLSVIAIICFLGLAVNAEQLDVSMSEAPIPNEASASTPRRETDLNGFRPETRMAQPRPQSVSQTQYRLHLGTPEERAAVEETRKNFRKISIALYRYRQDHDGKLPKWLSDLFPNYLEDPDVLLCPEVSTQTNFMPTIIDPHMETTFLYEFADVAAGGRNYHDWKTEQMQQYGDKVPIVRCFGFMNANNSVANKVLNLSYGGEIYFSNTMWENSQPTGHTPDEPAAKVRQQLLGIASALLKYREDHNGENPAALKHLIPEYLEDESQVFCVATDQPFTYTIPQDEEQKKEFKIKRDMYGDFVPIVRAEGVLENNRVINLGYTGEIWESGVLWQCDLGTPVEARVPIKTFRVGIPDRTIFFGIGVNMQWENEDQTGLKITHVVEGFPGDQAGLKKDDLIVAIEGFRIGSSGKLETLRDIIPFIKGREDATELTVLRSTEELKLVVHPAKMYYENGELVLMDEKEDQEKVLGKGWSNKPFVGRMECDSKNQVMALNGEWIHYGNIYEHSDTNFRQSVLIFEPVVKHGLIQLKATPMKGAEGFRIIFGFKSPKHYYVWNIGGWENTVMGLEKWLGINDKSSHQDMRERDKPFSVDYGKEYDVQLVLNENGNQVEGFVNEEKVWSFTSEESLRGRFGLSTWNTAVKYSDVVIQGKE